MQQPRTAVLRVSNKTAEGECSTFFGMKTPNDISSQFVP